MQLILKLGPGLGLEDDALLIAVLQAISAALLFSELLAPLLTDAPIWIHARRWCRPRGLLVMAHGLVHKASEDAGAHQARELHQLSPVHWWVQSAFEVMR